MSTPTLTDIASIHIDARRWFHRTDGNTYHTVRVGGMRTNGSEFGPYVSPMSYGYGEHYRHTAAELLRAEGILPASFDPYDLHPVVMRREHQSVYLAESVADVSRKRDLH